jgi:hypothetical protein
MNKILLAIPLLAMTACTDDPVPQTGTEEALSFSTYTGNLIAGSYDDGVTHIDLDSREIAPGVITTTITLDTLSYTKTKDVNTNTIAFENPLTAASTEQTAALHSLEDALSLLVDADDSAPTDVALSLHAMASMLSDWPAGEVRPPSVEVTMNRDIVNISPNNYCRTLYGDSCSPYKMTGKNSDNCKGRCGGGCNTARSGGYNRWTMDCAEHDYGINSWWDATDDWDHATLQYSSGGGCYFATNCNSSDGCANTAGGHGSTCD